MSGNTKEKIAVRNNAGKKTPAATAPMANAYANATVLEKIDNLAVTFRHRKCNNFRSLRGGRKRTQLGRYVATELKPALHSLCSDLSGLKRPQKSPPLRSLLNPHRNAFRFVSIGVSVEILRRKQVGLFLVCFHSLRSDLSDLQLAI
ncbi:hypothetical protein Bca101_070686 [Brassica carinata]